MTMQYLEKALLKAFRRSYPLYIFRNTVAPGMVHCSCISPACLVKPPLPFSHTHIERAVTTYPKYSIQGFAGFLHSLYVPNGWTILHTLGVLTGSDDSISQLQ